MVLDGHVLLAAEAAAHQHILDLAVVIVHPQHGGALVHGGVRALVEVSSFTPPFSRGRATQHSGSRKACSVQGVWKCWVSTYFAFLIAPSASPRETCL